MKTLLSISQSWQFTFYMFFIITINVHSQNLIYDNGPVYNIESPQLISLLQDETLNFNTYGFNSSREGGYRLLDEFILEKGAIIDYILLYAYQQNETEPSINAAYVQIWKGNPYYDGQLIWGDLVNNVITSVELSGGIRTTESMPNDQSRLIQEIIVNTPNLSLSAGEYWIDYSLEGNENSGPWSPPITITGVTHTGNAMQHNGWAYTAVIDPGVNEFQGIPFKVFGKTKSSTSIKECLECFIVRPKDSQNETLTFYPNPTKDFLNIESSQKVVEIGIYDLNGRKMPIEFNQSSRKADLRHLNPGTYSLLIRFENNEISNHRIIKR